MGTEKRKCDECTLWFNRTAKSSEAVCAPCRRGDIPVHGSRALGNRGCPCAACRKVMADYAKDRRKRGRVTNKRNPKAIVCRACGGTFMGVWAKYCSHECRGWEHGVRNYPHGNSCVRAKHYGVSYEYIDPALVFERDNWLCGICGADVDSSLSYPHRRSASLDHIIPMSRGGSHAYDNVQCSHLDCNVRKYNLIGGETSRRVGASSKSADTSLTTPNA